MKTLLISLLLMSIFVSLTTLATAKPKVSKRHYYECSKIGEPKIHPYYKHKIKHFGLVTKKTNPKLVVIYPKPKMYSAYIIN